MTKLTIDGEQKLFDAAEGMPLLRVLRDIFGITGMRFGCGIARCRARSADIDRYPLRCCVLPIAA